MTLKKLFSILLLGASLYPRESTLPSFYHTYEDIEAQLNVWDDQFGTAPQGQSGIIFHKEIIGYSTEDNLPFWAVKISDNADEDEDEPSILILGQCHAEEIYGVEIAMALINCLLNFGAENCFSSEIAGQVLYNLHALEIWIVPTYNPEGLRVVHGYQELDDDTTQWIQDESYRKNKRDINLDGIFNFDNTVEAGNDSDGVDLNRNYDFNWMFGDDVYVEDCNGNYCSHFDYYKGDAPFSETETQAIRDFAIEKQFLLSIAYHSSRSGNVSEKVIYSWEWPKIGEPKKPSPDFNIIQDIGLTIAGLIPMDSGGGSTYTPTTSKSMKGNAHDWFYKETGCFQYLIEVGTDDMQSEDSLTVSEVIENNFTSIFYVFNRAWGNFNVPVEKNQITGLVTDSMTGEPVQAQVKILEMDGGMLTPRLTNQFGRFRRLLNEGNYTLNVSAVGYENYEYSFYSSNASVNEHHVELTQKPQHSVSIMLSVPDGYSESLTMIKSSPLITDTLQIGSGESEFLWYENDYRLIILGNGLAPSIIDLKLDQTINLSLDLAEQEIMFSDSFEDLQYWTTNSVYWNADGKLRSQLDETYEDLVDIELTSNQIIIVYEDTEAVFRFDFRYELEWDNDTLSFGIKHINDNQIIWLKHWVNQQWDYHTEFIPFLFESESAYFPLIRLKSDENINFRGVEIESLSLIKGSSIQLNVEPSVIPSSFQLSQNYPNPFNSNTIITINLENATFLDFTIYDLNGRVVTQPLTQTFFETGVHSIPFQSGDLTSGIYFYSMSNESFSHAKKMILLK